MDIMKKKTAARNAGLTLHPYQAPTYDTWIVGGGGEGREIEQNKPKPTLYKTISYETLYKNFP